MEIENLTQSEQATNYHTFRHIETVRNLLNKMVTQLLSRGEMHDQTKLSPPEVILFAEFTPKLSGSTYGSEEYEEFRENMRPALDHHYAKNRHHPEHFADGVNDMNLLDLMEMFCDWKAATMRHNDGNLRKSIQHNSERFRMDAQLTRIFMNSLDLFD